MRKKMNNPVQCHNYNLYYSQTNTPKSLAKLEGMWYNIENQKRPERQAWQSIVHIQSVVSSIKLWFYWIQTRYRSTRFWFYSQMRLFRR